MCDCGYPFDRDAAVRARLGGFEPLSERQRRSPKGIPWRVNWVGMFVGGLPFFAIVAIRSSYDLPTPDVVRVGRLIGALAGIAIARWIYRRRNEAG